MAKKTERIFLSCSSKDETGARKVKHALSRYPGLRVFSPDMLSAGENWKSTLRKEIEKCDVFVVLLSEHAIQSGFVLTEVGAAWALGKPMIAVVTDPAFQKGIPIDMSQVPTFRINDLHKKRFYDQLLERKAA